MPAGEFLQFYQDRTTVLVDHPALESV